MPATRRHLVSHLLVALAVPFLIQHSDVDFAGAASPEHPVVPGFDRIYSAPNADAVEGGQLLLTELNCVSCHKADDATAELLRPKQAPVLDNVGARVDCLLLFGHGEC